MSESRAPVLSARQLGASLFAILLVLSVMSPFMMFGVGTVSAATALDQSFEDDAVGTTYGGWEVTDTVAFDGSQSIRSDDETDHDFQFTASQYGYTEFAFQWGALADSSESGTVQGNGASISLIGSGGYLTRFGIDSNANLYYYNLNDGWVDAGYDVTIDKWIKFKITIDWGASDMTIETSDGSSFTIPMGDASDFDTIRMEGENDGQYDYADDLLVTDEPLATVSGTVTDSDGNALSGVTVSTGTGTSDTTDSTGSWSFGLADGDYTLEASAEGYQNATKDVSVSGADVTDVNFTLGARLGGRVVACYPTDLECEDPTPLAGATVTIAALNTTAIQDKWSNVNSASEAEKKAAEIRKKIENFEFEEFNPNTDLTALLPSDGDKIYPVVHGLDDWGSLPTGAWIRNPLHTGGELGKPKLVIPEDKAVMLSAWDQDKTNLWRQHDEIDSSLPGQTIQHQTIKFEKLSRNGEVINTFEIETKPQIKIYQPQHLLQVKTHYGARASLPAGYYRMSVKGEEFSYLIRVGSGPKDIFPGYVNDLKTEAGEYTKTAQDIREYQANGTMDIVRTTSGPGGRWSYPISGDIETVSVHASKAGGNLDPDSGSILTQLRDIRSNTGYNGTIYLPRKPVHASPPEQNVDVKVTKFSKAPFEDMENLPERLLNMFKEWLGATVDEIRSFWDLDAGDMTKNQTGEAGKRWDDATDTVNNAIDNNGDLEDVLRDLADDGDITLIYDNETGEISTPDRGNLTDQELIERLRELEQAMDEMSEPAQEEPDISIENETLSGTFQFPGEIEPDTVSVIIEFADGDKRVVSEENYRVDSTLNPLAGDSVVVSSVSVAATRPEPRLIVDAQIKDGTLIRSEGTATNPAFPNDIPQLTAIDVSSLTPGTDSRVRVTPRPRTDSGYKNLTAATVYHPNGTKLATDLGGGDLEFNTNGAGTYTAVITYENNQGDSFLERVQVHATSKAGGIPPTLRINDHGPPTAGDGLSNAKVSSDGKVADVTAQIPGGGEINELHIRNADSLGLEEFNLQVVHGSAEERVRNHVTVYIHANLKDGTLLYRNNDQPITWAGETRYGVYDESDDMIQTYTDSSGTVSVLTIEDPSLVDRSIHRARVYIAGGISGLVTGGLLIWFGRRRRIFGGEPNDG